MYSNQNENAHLVEILMARGYGPQLLVFAGVVLALCLAFTILLLCTEAEHEDGQ